MNRQQRRAQARAGAKAGGAAQTTAAPAAATGVDPWLEEAATAHQTGNFAKAEAGYRRVLEVDPQHGDALNLLGVLALQTGDFEGAVQRLEPVVKRYPHVASYRANLANALRELGRSKDAAEHYRQTLKLDPNLATAHADYAVFLHKTEKLEQAESHYRQALAIDPQLKNANANLAALLQAQSLFEEALDFCDIALAIDPQHATALTVKGIALIELEREEDSLEFLEKAVRLNPDDVGARSALATALAKLGKIGEAQELQQAVLDADPDNAKMHSDRGWVMYQMGRLDVAFEHLMRALQLDSNLVKARTRLFQLLQAWHPTSYSPDLDSLILDSVNDPELKTKLLARPSARQILRKISHATGAKPTGVQQAVNILSNPLAEPLLGRMINTAPEFERILVILRRCLLLEGVGDLSGRDALPALSLIAQQAHNNSYVWWLKDDERRAVDTLDKEITSRLHKSGTPDEALELKLLRYAMYAPIEQLPCSDILLQIAQSQWSDAFRPVAERQLHEPREERRIAADIRALSSIENEISQAVQSQYEENPYPRWLSIEQRPQVTLDQFFREKFPRFELPAWMAQPIEMLIAGCGTGQQVMQRKLSYANMHVTAVDLSRASLAYAIRMGIKLGITGVDYLQGDILDLDELGRDFPVIECAGVLHHMDDPTAGWSVLTRLLRPGGVMLLGLYSELARQNIVAARKQVARLGLKPNADDIRAFRRRIISGEERALSQLMNSNDFYDLNNCRDLIFHVQEHRFTIPELQQIIADQRLEFLGFFFDDTLQNLAYDGMFPGDPNRTNLANWAVFEERHPYTFAGMYKFWCRKPE